MHHRTERLIELIPEQHIEWSAMKGKFTMGDLVRHIAGIERYLFIETIVNGKSKYQVRCRFGNGCAQ